MKYNGIYLFNTIRNFDGAINPDVILDFVNKA